MVNLFFQSGFAVLLSAIPVLMASDDNWQLTYGAALMGLTLAASMRIVSEASQGRMRSYSVPMLLGLIALLLGPIFLTTLVNAPDDVHIETIAVLLCYGVLASLMLPPDEASYKRFFMAVAVTQSVAALFVLKLTVDNSGVGWFVFLSERQRALLVYDGGVHPNFVGLLCVVVALAASGMVSVTRRGIFFAVAMVIAWLVSSRGALLAIVTMAGMSWFLLRERGHQGQVSRASTLRWWGGVAVFAVLLFVFRGAVVSFLSDDVLLLDDQYRGTESGFSDRLEIWEAVFELWWDNPLFGVGFGQHAELLGFGTYAHNMMLVLLSEEGLVGGLAFVVFSIVCLMNALAMRRLGLRVPATYLLCMIAGYWVYGMFEGRAINGGNPLSALFFLMCFASPFRAWSTSEGRGPVVSP